MLTSSVNHVKLQNKFAKKLKISSAIHNKHNKQHETSKILLLRQKRSHLSQLEWPRMLPIFTRHWLVRRQSRILDNQQKYWYVTNQPSSSQVLHQRWWLHSTLPHFMLTPPSITDLLMTALMFILIVASTVLAMLVF